MPSSLAQKLQIKPGQRMSVVNMPADHAAALQAVLAEVPLVTDDEQDSEAVLIFVHNLAETQNIAANVMAASASDRLLWVAYPKGTSKIQTDVNRDRLWRALESTGWRPVRQIALDATWSAIRFRFGVAAER